MALGKSKKLLLLANMFENKRWKKRKKKDSLTFCLHPIPSTTAIMCRGKQNVWKHSRTTIGRGKTTWWRWLFNLHFSPVAPFLHLWTISWLEGGRQPWEEAVEGQEERDEQYEQGHQTQRRRLSKRKHTHKKTETDAPQKKKEKKQPVDELLFYLAHWHQFLNVNTMLVREKQTYKLKATNTRKCGGGIQTDFFFVFVVFFCFFGHERYFN